MGMTNPNEPITREMELAYLRLEVAKRRYRAVAFLKCEKCDCDVDWEPSHPAEPDTNTPAWGGGYICEHCGFVDECQPYVPERSDEE